MLLLSPPGVELLQIHSRLCGEISTSTPASMAIPGSVCFTHRHRTKVLTFMVCRPFDADAPSFDVLAITATLHRRTRSASPRRCSCTSRLHAQRLHVAQQLLGLDAMGWRRRARPARRLDVTARRLHEATPHTAHRIFITTHLHTCTTHKMRANSPLGLKAPGRSSAG